MTAREQAAVIADSLLAALRIADERHELTAENLERIALAAGNNAAMLLSVADEDGGSDGGS